MPSVTGLIPNAAQFRQWAITILQQYIHKGFAIDGDRFKYGSRFSTRFFDDCLNYGINYHGRRGTVEAGLTGLKPIHGLYFIPFRKWSIIAVPINSRPSKESSDTPRIFSMDCLRKITVL